MMEFFVESFKMHVTVTGEQDRHDIYYWNQK